MPTLWLSQRSDRKSLAEEISRDVFDFHIGTTQATPVEGRLCPEENHGALRKGKWI